MSDRTERGAARRTFRKHASAHSTCILQNPRFSPILTRRDWGIAVKTPSPAKTRKPKAAAPAAAPDPASAIDEPLTFDDDGIKRVQDIIRNARATWFALLGALVFASVTLASVKDISFFVNSVETKLPVVGISVPVISFFWAGSLLIAALYAYFHLYLELLWQALGDAPARISGQPLADRIEPWIVADSALRLRDRLRGAHGEERSSRKRAMQFVSDVVSVGLVWVFGLVVIFWFWWRSMPAHEPLLTGFIGAVLAGTLWVFCTGIDAAAGHLSDKKTGWRWKLVFVLLSIAIIGLTVVRTWTDLWVDDVAYRRFSSNYCYSSDEAASHCNDRFFLIRRQFLRAASANLNEVVFTEKPKDWVGREIAEI